MDERPTQPILTAPGEMPDGAPSPDLKPPDRQRAQDLARSFLAGPPAQKVVGRAGCEEMARWIKVQPDWVAVIDEWLVATVAVERMRARGEPLSPAALVRLDTAERALAGLSSLDRRFADQLRRSQPALELDAPGPYDVTDHEILAYARTLRDGTVTDALARQTCIIALGLGGPLADGRALARGKSVADIIAQARTWCVVQIRERDELARRAANPDPEYGPARYRAAGTITEGGHTFVLAPTGERGIHSGRSRLRVECHTCASLVHEGTTSASAVIERHLRDKDKCSDAGLLPQASRNRSRKAREMAGLSVAQAAKLLSIDGETLVDIEANELLYHDAPIAGMAELYRVSPEWLRGEIPEHDYVRVDAMTGADKLTAGDRDTIAQFAAAMPRNVASSGERLAAVAAARSCLVDNCTVCGRPLADHQPDTGDGCPANGGRACPAVAP